MKKNKRTSLLHPGEQGHQVEPILRLPAKGTQVYGRETGSMNKAWTRSVFEIHVRRLY